jgi:hypothetical protein
MPPRIKVKTADGVIRKQRDEAAQHVITNFGNRLPELRLLCFFDDQDWLALRGPGMAANRGIYIRKGSSPAEWHEACTFVDGLLDFDNFIYLHGSTCSNDVGLTMTFAHELQHFVQYGFAPRLSAENTLAYATLRNLEPADFEAFGLRSCDIPHEREARIVAKRVAEARFGVELVRQYIDTKRAEFVTAQDATDWDCIRDLVASTPYDLAAETKLFFPRLKGCRLELQRALRSLQARDPDFNEINLDALLSG